MGWKPNQQHGYDLVESTKDALHPSNLLKRFVVFVVFAIVLAHKQLISNIDAVGQQHGTGWMYVKAIMSSMWEGVYIALGSIWVVITRFNEYLASNSWGSILFTFIMIAALLLVFYQPVSLIMNLIDGEKGQGFDWLLRLLITIIVIVIASGVVYYFGGQEIVTTVIGSGTVPTTITPTINETVQALSNATSNTSVISLL